MKPFSHVAEALCKLRLDEHVNVLRRHVKLELSALDVRKDLLETADKLQAVAHADYALFAEHGRVGNAALDILFVHSSVESDRRIERVNSAVHAL